MGNEARAYATSGLRAAPYPRRARAFFGALVIVVAGMEGRSRVSSGLISAPVIAVPTSVGYGASFGGIAALLGMLNSCSSGVSVVNIDNGFGAANIASLINHL
jgi:NCAIR mutase (PurE)-related protein